MLPRLVCQIYFYTLFGYGAGILQPRKDTSTFLKCDTAKRAYQNVGFISNDIYLLEQTGKDLKVCDQMKSCCKGQAEKNLVKTSELLRKSMMNDTYREIKSLLEGASSSIIKKFQSLLSNSQQYLDQMFEKTYGSRYENNSELFKSLYVSLHQYMNGSELDLESSVDTFFANLHETIYIMSMPFSVFDQKYKNCINEKTNLVQPFGDIQHNIAHQMSRAFMAARVYQYALRESIQIVSALSQMPFHSECSVAFMKMTQCSLCAGVDKGVKPCFNYCHNVMKGCFAYTIIIQPKWNEFLNSMLTLVQKLEGPFSIEAVVDPLGIKISEAIMVFQANLRNITDRVEEKCGVALKQDLSNLNLKKRRRQARALEKNFLSHANNPFGVFPQNKKPASEYEKLLQRNRGLYQRLSLYWMQLPKEICTRTLGETDQSKECWNGRNTSGYHHKVVSNQISDLFENNPELQSNPLKANPIILKHVYKLEVLIENIKMALVGKTDCGPDCEMGEGSGSGFEASGSSGIGSSVDESSGLSSGDYTTTDLPPPTTEPTKTTHHMCSNSVDKNCIIQNTKSVNKVDNNIKIFEPIFDDVSGPFERLGLHRVGAASRGLVNCFVLVISLLTVVIAL